MYLKIKTIIDSERAITWNDGDKFALALTRQFKLNNILEYKDIVIDFAGLESVTSAFMNRAIFNFLIHNKSAIDSLEFIDSSREDYKVDDYVQLCLDRLIRLALDDELRAIHEKSLNEIMEDGYEPF
jgi:hypothetical protein